MIKPINQSSMSFKALYKSPKTQLTKEQQYIYDDIEKKVNAYPLNSYDFFAVPRDKKQIELFAISTPTYDLKTGMPNSDYKKSVGIFSELYPFDENKVDKKAKAGIFWTNWGNIITSAVALVCLLGAVMAFSTRGKKQPVKEITEKVVTIKDFLNKTSNDTLELTKKVIK